jgi:Rrf2 family protein
MNITRQADYAVRAVWHLADLGPGKRVSTASIATQQHIPISFLAKIIAQLSAAGIVHAMRGARGGVGLGRPASEITLLDVVQVIDGPVRLNECVTDVSVCTLGDQCPVHTVWCEAQSELVKRLDQTSFAQLTSARQPLPAPVPAA